jgi:DNA-directed RNA polymerase omega subunit
VANLSLEEIEIKLGSRYALTVLAGKRAQELRRGSDRLVTTEATNPVVIALQEIQAGLIYPVAPVAPEEKEIEVAPATDADFEADNAVEPDPQMAALLKETAPVVDEPVAVVADDVEAAPAEAEPEASTETVEASAVTEEIPAPKPRVRRKKVVEETISPETEEIEETADPVAE